MDEVFQDHFWDRMRRLLIVGVGSAVFAVSCLIILNLTDLGTGSGRPLWVGGTFIFGMMFVGTLAMTLSFALQQAAVARRVALLEAKRQQMDDELAALGEELSLEHPQEFQRSLSALLSSEVSLERQEVSLYATFQDGQLRQVRLERREQLVV